MTKLESVIAILFLSEYIYSCRLSEEFITIQTNGNSMHHCNTECGKCVAFKPLSPYSTIRQLDTIMGATRLT